MNISDPLAEVPQTEFHDYFEKFGYRITWDFNRRDQEYWYELYEGNQLVAQIDMGVPVAHIIEDMCQWHLGKDGTSPSDYKVSCMEDGIMTSQFKRLLKRVYKDNQKKRSSI